MYYRVEPSSSPAQSQIIIIVHMHASSRLHANFQNVHMFASAEKRAKSVDSNSRVTIHISLASNALIYYTTVYVLGKIVTNTVYYHRASTVPIGSGRHQDLDRETDLGTVGTVRQKCHDQVKNQNKSTRVSCGTPCLLCARWLAPAFLHHYQYPDSLTCCRCWLRQHELPSPRRFGRKVSGSPAGERRRN
jgi:hypothetical protein